MTPRQEQCKRLPGDAGYCKFSVMMKFRPQSAKVLPKELTSYDLVKTFAVILMLVDHATYYFFPEPEFVWFRVLGRMCVPAWFFLIGYARSRDLGVGMWAGTALLVVANIITGQFILPMSILATIIFMRVVIDPVMERALRDYEILLGIALVAFFLALPAGFLWEYGTSGLLFAMFGWFMRNPDRVSYRMKWVVEGFVLLFCVVGFGFLQMFLFHFDRSQSIALFAGLAIVCAGLYFFRPLTFPSLTSSLPGPVVWLLQLMGRRTLEIYVIHLIIFKFVALMIGDPRFGWFDFSLMMK